MGLTPKKRRILHKLKKDEFTMESRSGNVKCLKKFTIVDFILITIQYRTVLYNKVFNFIFSVEEK